MSDEMERAAAAQASYNLATFMTSLRSATTSTYQTQILNIQSRAAELDRTFQAADGGWHDGDVRCVGGQATFLRGLETSEAQLVGAVPEPIAYEARLITRWITDSRAGGEGYDNSLLGGFHDHGTIEAKFNTDGAPGRYTYTFVDAKLYTVSNAGNAADMLTRVMRQQNKKVYEMGIPVAVKLYGPNLVGGSGYTSFMVRSRSNYDRTGIGPQEMNQRWNEMPWGPIDAINNVDGG